MSTGRRVICDSSGADKSDLEVGSAKVDGHDGRFDRRSGSDDLISQNVAFEPA